MARLVERLARSGHGSALAAQPAGSGLAAAPGRGGRLDAGFAVLLVGASLEQSIKQLPARHRICPAAFAAYSQAADLRNGIPWYATLGLGAPALTLAAATVGRRHRPPAWRRWAGRRRPRPPRRADRPSRRVLHRACAPQPPGRPQVAANAINRPRCEGRIGA